MILDKVNKPSDLKTLQFSELIQLCQELRTFIIQSIAENPGHLGANLGVIELTVALHYVFNAPYDKIVWDVGHQAYAHKILTGRKKLFHTNRKLKGISGFPKMYESPYDAFGTGHASTSISAILGMAIADKLQGITDRHHVAVIGDGGLTGGMAFEALNHAGELKPNILVILNDNGIAIDQNVGAIKEYFARITASRTYNKIKWTLWRIFRRTWVQTFVNKITTAIKSSVLRKSNFFESLNFRYFGPIDGHNLKDLIRILQDLKEIDGPKLLHIITKKGKGYEPAEQQQTLFHSPGRYDVETGEIIETHNGLPRYQDVYGKTLVELARMNPKIVAITPAMLSGSSLTYMQKEFPHRTFDVGIAEQHAVTFAAGLAASGMIPYCTVYSTFLQRAYDQIIHDVALQKLPVIFGIDRAGIVGEDGQTHQGQFDLAFLRPIPNLIISAAYDEIQLRNLMYTAQFNGHQPFAIRYPKGLCFTKDWQQPFQELEIGKARILHTGNDIAILSIGVVGQIAFKAAQLLQTENIHPYLVDVIFLKPLDEKLILDVLKNFSIVITMEDGVIKGGLFSEVSELIAKYGLQTRVIPLGIPDIFVEQGSREQLLEIVGLSVQHVVDVVKKHVLRKNLYFCT